MSSSVVRDAHEKVIRTTELQSRLVTGITQTQMKNGIPPLTSVQPVSDTPCTSLVHREHVHLDGNGEHVIGPVHREVTNANELLSHVLADVDRVASKRFETGEEHAVRGHGSAL